MKRIGIVLVALVAILVLPGAAKADSISSGALTSPGFDFSGINGSGSLSDGQTFSLTDGSYFGLFSVNTIMIGSFQGSFTAAGFSSSPVSCSGRCSETQYSANFVGAGGMTGSITFVVNNFNGVIISGTESIAGVAGVPEPGTLGMFAAGLLGVGLMLSRRSKAAQVSA